MTSAEATPETSASSRLMSAAGAARLAAGYLAELTDRVADDLVLVEPIEDGWRVGLEVVEVRRIPDTTDIMAVYEVNLDACGDLVSCRRERRYQRGQTGKG
jgi:gas vesicle protein GvpO